MHEISVNEHGTEKSFRTRFWSLKTTLSDCKNCKYPGCTNAETVQSPRKYEDI